MRIRAGLICLVAGAALAAVVAAPDPRGLVSRLGSTSAAERDAAATDLAKLGRDAEPALAEAASSPDAEVRSRARALLSRLRDDGSAEARRRVREAWTVLRPDGRAFVVPAPGSAEDARLARLLPESGDVLAAAALREDSAIFTDGGLARALARHATPSTLEALAKLWQSERLIPSSGMDAARTLDEGSREPDRRAAVRAMAEGARRALGDPFAAREAPRRRAGIALAAAFGDGADVGVRAARDVDPGVRREAARLLAVHRSGPGDVALRELAMDADPSVRAAALESLARLGPVPRPEPALASAGHADASVRAAAAALLATDATRDEIPALRALASDPSARVRAAARRGLVSFGL